MSEIDLRQKVKARYKNGPDNIGRDFIAPCLKEAVLYRRGTGFFSSGAMIAYVDAIDHLVSEKTKIEIICSPVINDKALYDILSRNVTEEQKRETLKKYANNIFLAALGYKLNQERKDYRRQLLAYFIAKNILEIRFAVPFDLVDFKLEEGEENELTENLYHVKTGYFRFANGDVIAFDGSFNESDSGHKRHIDKTQVFRSWEPSDAERLEGVVSDIDDDWNGKNKYIQVFKLSEEALEWARKLSPETRPRRRTKDPASEKPSIGGTAPPDSGGLRDYQRQALEAWKANEYRGILAMATGTGKTKTAIAAIKAFRGAASNGLVVVTAPYQPLANQWIKELSDAGLTSIKVFENSSDWVSQVSNLIQAHMSGLGETGRNPILVCVNKTFRDVNFQSILSLLDKSEGSRMLVVDECHHFNSAHAIRDLPLSFKFRLGLSATPYEEGELHHLDAFFECIVYEYEVSKAIADGYLSPYYYYPIFIELTQSEASKYVEVCSKIRGKSGENTSDVKNDETLVKFYRELDGLLENVVGKLSKLAELVVSIEDRKHSLFYCGVGSVSFNDGETVRQIIAVTQVLHRLGWSVSKVTYQERNADQRKAIFNSFTNGTVDALASIRVLDEGVDIPDCKRAFILASQRSDRQGVQRRGRILRRSPDKAYAELYDFIITGPSSEEKFLRNLYEKELRRASLFAEDALNRDQCNGAINSAR